jgi:hypothetical protein
MTLARCPALLGCHRVEGLREAFEGQRYGDVTSHRIGEHQLAGTRSGTESLEHSRREIGTRKAAGRQAALEGRRQ